MRTGLKEGYKMILWITIALLVAGTCLWTIGPRLSWEHEKEADGMILAGSTITVISFSAAMLMMVAIISNNLKADAKKEELREQYSAIMYKVENGRDELGIKDKEILDDIEQWNTSIKHYKTLQSNVWIGIFVPDIYDEFDTIDYEIVGKTG
jgi:hypothetical protein